jgi:hypothetical protein
MLLLHLDDLIGEVVVVGGGDHRHGSETLRLRVLRVALLRRDPGWAAVLGSPIDADGVEQGVWAVTVRVDALLPCRTRRHG